MAKGIIPKSDIEAIRERTPIDEIIGEYVQLKPAGVDSLKGLSPFKDEKTPSFHVRPNHGYYHCFSTGQGGDVFSFLMEVEQLSFPEAVEYCAEKIGYHINYQGGTTGGRREEPGTRRRLVAANRAAHEFYMQNLLTPEAEPARRFLLERGFGKDIIMEFGCGYAPDGWDTLTKYLQRKGFDFKELEAAGLSKMGKRGPIDRFHRRLLWPIKNLSGDVIGFGARKLFDDDNLGKYMNTPETMLYKKSKVLFGLDMAKRHIASGHQTVVVEGYTDVMAMHAAGVKTAVASCGTAFGDEHLQMIRRLMLDDSFFRGELIYTFDGDEAGQKAALRAFEGDQEFTGQSFVAIAPDGMDPCDLRLQRGDVAVRDLVANRFPMYEFVLRTLIEKYPLDSFEGRLQALERTVPVVAQIRDKALQSQYARQLDGWIGWNNPSEVLQKVREEAKKPKQQRRTVRKKEDFTPVPVGAPQAMLELPHRKDPRLWPARESLKLALQMPLETIDEFLKIPSEAFTQPAYSVIRQAIEKAHTESQTGGVDWLSHVTDNVADLLGKSLVSELAVEEIMAPEDRLDGYIKSTFARLKEQNVGNKIAVLKSKLQRMRPSDDEKTYNSMFAALVELETQRRALQDEAMNVTPDY